MSHQFPEKGLDRRSFLKIGGMSTLALTLASTGLPGDLLTNTVQAEKEVVADSKLQFNPDGKFKIVQFNDTQDDERIDRRTLELMEKVLDSEKPDFVVLNGDNITGGCDSELEMQQALNNVAQPMERRKIKWAVTFGNHDEDSTPQSGMDEKDILNFYKAYKYNINEPGVKEIAGTGNMNLTINNPKGIKPLSIFGYWIAGDMRPQQ